MPTQSTSTQLPPLPPRTERAHDGTEDHSEGASPPPKKRLRCEKPRKRGKKGHRPRFVTKEEASTLPHVPPYKAPEKIDAGLLLETLHPEYDCLQKEVDAVNATMKLYRSRHEHPNAISAFFRHKELVEQLDIIAGKIVDCELELEAVNEAEERGEETS